jgi:hypothetical protein
MAELLGLAATCFLAATLFPLPSEGALLVYLHFHPERTALAVAVATVANTAGGMTSYAIGRFIPHKQFNRERCPGSGVMALPPRLSHSSRSLATPYALQPAGCGCIGWGHCYSWQPGGSRAT